MEINIVLAIFLLCLLSFFEFIVFNEEILLALCFLSFLFYCFNTLSSSIFAIFESRANKYEQDLLASFGVTKMSLINDFNARLNSKSIVVQSAILFSCITQYLTKYAIFVKCESSWSLFQTGLLKFDELILANKNFVDLFQKSVVIRLLYSLILKKSNNDLSFLISKTVPFTKYNELKYLTTL